MPQFELQSYLKLGRATFLIYSPVAYSLGVAIVSDHSTSALPNIGWFVYGQLIVTLVHAMTHYINEYYDFETDRRNMFVSLWTGGSRELRKGKVPPWHSLFIGWWLTFLVAALAVPLHPVNQTIVALALVLSFGYSWYPLAFNWRGLGELTVALVLNVMVPVFGYTIQYFQVAPTAHFTASAILTPPLREAPWPSYFVDPLPNLKLFLLLLPHALVEWVRMQVMGMPDRLADASVGKCTLPVLLGPRRCSLIHAAGMLSAYFFIIYFGFAGLVPWKLALPCLCTAPLGLWISKALVCDSVWASVDSMYAIPFWSSVHNASIMVATLVPLLSNVDPLDPRWALKAACVVWFSWRILSNLGRGYVQRGTLEPPFVLDNCGGTSTKQRWDELLAEPGSPLEANLLKKIILFFDEKEVRPLEAGSSGGQQSLNGLLKGKTKNG